MTAASVPSHVLFDFTASLTGGTPPERARTGEIRAFATCRNERLRLPAFLDHYRRLGVDRFFIIDNDSSDGTADYLLREPDVRLFRTAARYSEAAMGIDWVNTLLAAFGVGAWCVTVDIDELLVYPGSERAPLRTLTAYLDRNGYGALSCTLLDLYPDQPLNECVYEPGDDLIAAAPYFDAGPYRTGPFELCPWVLIHGGMRERMFHPEFKRRGVGAKLYEALYHRILRHWSSLEARPPQKPPLLTKVPLVRWDERTRYLKSTHGVSRKVVAPDTGVLLHFKFLHDFHARAVEEAARGEHYDNASEYRRYADRLDRDPNLTFMCEASTRFETTTQLVHLGLMRDTAAWTSARYRSTGTT